MKVCDMCCERCTEVKKWNFILRSVQQFLNERPGPTAYQLDELRQIMTDMEWVDCIPAKEGQ